MTNQKVEKWLAEKAILLEESFTDALKNYALEYKQAHEIQNIDQVYSKIGLKKQYLAYWAKNPSSVQTKKL